MRAPTRRTRTNTAPRTSSGFRRKPAGSYLQASAKQPTIGKLIDDAMVAIERDNPRLKGVLPKDYARPALDKHRLGELIDLIGTIGLGDKENRSKDILGRVYEYFLSQFASAEGKNGGQFYTPRCVVRVLVEMLAPVQGPGLRPVLRLRRHVRAEREIRRSPRRRIGDISIYGQETNADDMPPGADEPRHPRHRSQPRPRAGRHLPPRPASRPEGRFHPCQPAVQRFRLGSASDDDVRWQFGVPPEGNANYAWVQHFIHHLAPDGHGRLCARQRQHVVEPVRRRRDSQSHRRSRPRRLHGRAARPTLLLHADSGLPVVSDKNQERTASAATVASRHSSSTHANSAR